MFNQKNVGEAVSSFIEKSKKQAKKILKISKEKNGFISIENLAQAQELVAKFNGYPNWHAMQESHKEVTRIKDNVKNHFQLNLVSSLNYQARNINLFEDENQPRVTLIVGQPGVGKSTVKDKVIFETLTNNKTMVSKVTVMDIGKKYYKDYGLSHENELLNIDVYKDSINLLETPMGLNRVYPKALKEDIYKTLMVSMGIDEYSAEYHIYSQYFDKVFEELKTNPQFEKPFDDSCDSISKIIKEKSKYVPTTWFEASHVLMKLKYVDEAKIAHKKSCCNLSDFRKAHMLCFEKSNNKEINGNGLVLFLNLFESEYLNLTTNENVHVSDTVKMVNISMDLRFVKAGFSKNNNDFIANMMMVFAKREVLQSKEYFNVSKAFFKEELQKNKRLTEDVMVAFYDYNQKIATRELFPQLVAFDESHRFKNFSVFNDLVLRAKEENLAFLIMSQYPQNEWTELGSLKLRVLLNAKGASTYINEGMLSDNIVNEYLNGKKSLLVNMFSALNDQLTLRQWYYFEFDDEKAIEDIVVIQ